MNTTSWSLPLTLAMLVCACGPAPLRPPSYENEPAPAPTPRASDAPARRGPPPVSQNPFYWTVRRDGAVSHLFGTAHAGVSLDNAFPADAYGDIAEAREVWLEVDPAALSLSDLPASAQLPRGETLETHLSSSTWHALAQRLHTRVNTPELRPLRPWVPMLLLVTTQLEAMPGAGASMDSVLATALRDQTLPHRVLEDAQTQFDALAGLPNEATVELLSELLQNEAAAQTRLRGVVSAYESGEIEQVAQVLDDESQRALVSIVYDGGQPVWMNELEAGLEEGGMFAAIGVGHLIGSGRLIERLRSSGFEVSR